ncbi:MAG: hypothetical protein H4O13_09200 [Xanthomonadales bacterium]|nr:hypothetical protein [Xanthomonadales bacterium]
MLRRLLIALSLLPIALPALAEDRHFEIEYRVAFLPDEGVAAVTLDYTPGEGRIRGLDFAMPDERYSGFGGDGAIERRDDRLIWTPPAKGGALRWRYKVNKQRRDDGYDARMTDDWALLRGDHLVPPARARLTRDSRALATIRFELPAGWVGVDTPFKRRGETPVFDIDDDDRRFQRPVGWMIAGDIGIRRDFIGDMEAAVAAPKGDPMRRNEYLAFLNLVAGEMEDAFGALPDKVLIVGAGDPMWRGGLSGPRSLYLHSDRPLISENGTSTLVHEMVHVISRVRGAAGDDWIAEGFAEFYSIEMMRRVGLLNEARAQKAFDWMRSHGRRVETLKSNRSRGPRTARAVALFVDLDREVQRLTDDRRDIDDVSRLLVGRGRVSLEELREAFEKVVGEPSEVLDSPLLR